MDVADEFKTEECTYWKERKDLLKKFKGKWVAIAKEKVAAVGETLNDVLEEAYGKGYYVVYANKVGEEQKVMRRRIREVRKHHYNMNYDPPMPIINVKLMRPDRKREIEVTRIIDSGADLSVIPGTVCALLSLYDFPVSRVEVGGVDDKMAPGIC